MRGLRAARRGPDAPILRAQGSRLRRARAAALAAGALAVEYARVVAMGPAEIPAGVAGGVLLGALALPYARRPGDLGLSVRPPRVAGRVLGTAALTAVLLLPAAVRWPGHAPLAGWEAVMVVVIAAGEELAFRGALYAALEGLGGPALAVAGSSVLWAAAHVLSHPPQFLPAVLAAGVVLGLWRWAARDLVAPIAAHVAADLLL